MTTFLELAERRGVVWPLTTERLAIEPVTPGTAASLWEYWRLEETYRWLGSRYTSLEGLAEAKSTNGACLAIRLRSDPAAVVGDMSVRIKDAWSQSDIAEEARDQEAELGWVMNPAHQRRGYAFEAVSALITLIFGDLGLHRIEAGAYAANEASWKLMEKLGMRRESYTVRDGLHRDDGWTDGVGYAILAEEWAVGSPSRDNPR